jgi:hypothetical protein
MQDFYLSDLIFLGLGAWILTRYLVKHESGSWLHSKVDWFLYNRAEKAKAKLVTSFLEFVRFGWGCTICAGQWISFGLVWGIFNVPPWEWSRPWWLFAVSVNGVNAAMTVAETVAKGLGEAMKSAGKRIAKSLRPGLVAVSVESEDE